jgi:hypothetical protein
MNKRSFLVLASFGLFVAFITNSCVKDIGKYPVAPPKPVNVCDSATYTFKIKSIIDANCVSCHSPTGQKSDVPLTDYSLVKAKADAGRIKARMIDAAVGNTMPPAGKLSQDKLDLIQCWLDKSSPE